ncbi:MAG TPA: type II toxin-antitoxin system RelE/ParE family toxin [Candidatus Binatia bacterium]
MAPERKPLFWVASSKENLKDFPPDVQDVMGYALDLAQQGLKHPDAKPLSGFGGAGVLEIVEDFATDTYRTVYTVKFAGAVYVLHAFQKKSKHGIQMPKRDKELIRRRLKGAQENYADWIEREDTQ